MNRRIRNISYLTAVILLLIAAVSYEQAFYNELSSKNISKNAQHFISSQSHGIDQYHELIKSNLEKGNDLWALNIPSHYFVSVATRNKVEFWNSNRISPESIPFSPQLSCRRIDNAWFLYKSSIYNNSRIDVLVNIKNNYIISNEYFSNDNTQQGEFSQYTLSEKPKDGFTPVMGHNNQALFYFAKTEISQYNQQHSLLATVLYLALFFAILLFLSQWHTKAYINLLSIITFGSLVILLCRYIAPISILEHSRLFSPELYHNEGILNSLGLLFTSGLLWIVLSFLLSQIINQGFRPNKIQTLGISILMLVIFHIIIQGYINVIQTTSINLQLVKIETLTQDTIWVYATLLLFLGGWGKLAVNVTNSFHQQKQAYLTPLMAIIACIPLMLNSPIPIAAATVYLCLLLISARKRHSSQYGLLQLLFTSALLALLISHITEIKSTERNKKHKEELITSLPATLLAERDYQVEEQLLDIWNEIQNDMTLQNIPMMMFSTSDYYANYLKQNYFTGSLKEYELQVVICNPEHYLQIEGMSSSPNCYAYFGEKLRVEGERILNTHFYWQNNNNGRISYFGWLKVGAGTLLETSIFVDLESPILSEGQGYPALLRDKSKNDYTRPEGLSFARYANGRLITSSGDFKYPSSDQWLPKTEKVIFNRNFDKHHHLCFNNSESCTVILSEKKKNFFYPIYAFIYTFLLVYISFLIANTITRSRHICIKQTISNEIRLTIFGVLFLSLIMVGIASVLFPLGIYKKNQETSINEKTESIMTSLSREVASAHNLHNASQAGLQSLLYSLSNTLHKDIHIYDLNGLLYSSSRVQLFNYKLQGNIINPEAYQALNKDEHMAILIDEQLGSNEYKSNYLALTNANDVPIGYVNIPFFSSQQELEKSILDYIIVLLNIYLLLIILVLTLTYISVSRLTKPLIIIQDGLSKMKLGSNEKIVYKRQDELGSLVDKYNVMVDELNASIQQLTQSEREIAWQSMARQIAHEIKNPLTPMKLSIQHLERTKKTSPEQFDEYFNKTAHTLVEQIDNLSSIATSFSTFAKVSDAIPVHLNLNERLENMVTLFGQSGSHISFTPNRETIFVEMDKDHFIQVFNNLVKNALQAIPEGQDGTIKISIQQDNLRVYISVSDNGSGIDEATQEKIFQPNFTTKNSGMGLGLAISQKMANNANGDITFVSKVGEGTTFTVNLPISLENNG